MPLVTPEQLVQILLAHPKKGAKQVVLVMRTRPELLRKSRVTGIECPWPQGIERIAVRAVTLGASYEKAVNRQRVKESEHRSTESASKGRREYFQAEQLWHGLGIHDTAYTVKHKKTGRVYFATKPSQGIADTIAGSAASVRDEQWRDVATSRVLNFEVDRLSEYLPAQSKSQVQNVEHDVQWRTIALDSVIELRYGDVYQLKHAA